MSQRDNNIRIIQDTISICQTNTILQNSIQSSLEKSHIYWEGDQIHLDEPYYNRPASVILSSKRTIEAASFLNIRDTE